MPDVGELFAFEEKWGPHTSAKEAAILDQLHMRPARYYLALHRAAVTHEGQAANPIIAHRISQKLIKRR